MRRAFALVAVAVIAVVAPAVATAHAQRMPAIVAYTFPQQCTVLPVKGKPFVKARGLLAELGCRVRRVQQQSTARKGLVVSVVGGTRSYAFGHTVTLIVSSGPATATSL